jgi:hypothetical protein
LKNDHLVSIAHVDSGAISDSSTSKYRRRYWIVTSTIVLVFSTLALAYCQSIAAFFVDLFGGGLGDWDPERMKQVNSICGIELRSRSLTRDIGVSDSHRLRHIRLLSLGLCAQCFASISA